LLAGLGDLSVKIKDIINEAFGTQGVRDPYSYDYEKDPETGEYTGRSETNPRSFTNMIAGVADRLSAGSGSQWVSAPDADKKDTAIDRYKVPPYKMLVVTARNGKKFFKLPAKDNATDQSGYWVNEENTQIFDPQALRILEQLARKNGQLVVNPADLKAAQQAADDYSAQQAAQQAEPGAEKPEDELYGEPSVTEPLHPDVSIVQSVPLVIQYKGKRFEMDDYGEFHPFGTTRKVTPALQTFLTKERGKL